MRTASRMIAKVVMAMAIPALTLPMGASGANDGKKPGDKKGAACTVQECKRVFDDAGMTCNNPKPRPSQGEFGQRCQCDCLDEGGARKKKS